MGLAAASEVDPISKVFDGERSGNVQTPTAQLRDNLAPGFHKFRRPPSLLCLQIFFRNPPFPNLFLPCLSLHSVRPILQLQLFDMSNFLNQDFGSEDEDEDFNPVPVAGSDDEDAKPAKEDGDDTGALTHEGDAEAEDEKDEKHNDAEDDEEEEDDDDEEEDEEEEEVVRIKQSKKRARNSLTLVGVKNRPRKRRRGGVHNFFEEEAGVDEEEDEAEDEEDELAEFGTEMHPDDLDALPAGAETDDRRHRQLDRQRELDATMDAEKQAQMLKERYGRNRAAATDALVIPKRLLLPSVEDPSIWGARCKPGKEREVVFNIQKRIQERPAHSRNPLRILSAFERGNVMQGWFYVEAQRQPDVIAGLDQLNHYFPSRGLTLIPVKDMPDLLRVRKSEELHPGGWVRVARGKYKGDLAQIEEVETNGLTVTVRIVPRLDYGMNEDDNALAPGADVKRKRATNKFRPPQRLFSEAEAKKKHAKHLSATSGLRGKSWNYMNDNYEDGFLIKDMRLNHLTTKNVNPRLEEVTMFARGSEDGTANLDLAALADTMKKSTASDSYQPGDPVEVYRGEQQGLVGRAESTRGDIVSLRVTEGELSGHLIDAPVLTLRKRFREGDHVKVIGGSRFQNELGMVVEVKDDNVTILSDSTMEEITVFSKDLRLSGDTDAAASKGPSYTGQCRLHDLLQLDNSTVGCAIKVERDRIQVLDQHGSVRDCTRSQVINIIKRDSYKAVDADGAEITVGETIKEPLGEKRKGEIIYIYRGIVFAIDKERVENGGVWVTRAINTRSSQPAGGRELPSLDKPNPQIMNQQLKNNYASPIAMPSTGGRDRLVGQTVSIRRGPLKGLLGRVPYANEKLACVEFVSGKKPVMIPREDLLPRDPITNQPIHNFGGRGRGSRVPFGSSTAPPRRDGWQGGRTPMAAPDSSRTPAWAGASSSRTPAWGSSMSGSRTPAWKNDGSRTSNPYDAGNRTAYGGGNRTPAWNTGSRTPFAGAGGDDAFVTGSRTPAWGAGNRTPAWGSLASAQDQRDFDDAPTPGGYSAPTPGGYAAPTPGASAPTPGAWGADVPTPGAFNAPTPGGLPKRSGYDAPTPAAYDAPTPAMGGAAATPGAGYGDEYSAPQYEENTPSP
ncbi:Transcription elongation factor spt5 [Penicillium argentinense]|uniref:Transcription elongation factor SPT5 n=1 Tax=Penicillium argentinense TaxID=1131581 RepID=A0A9W9EZ96_9EURO|nr:Transcription elongation factor spt5 [Penicillium argentinense]KAJ5090624.1 Transcription elongation factor spt5 [Penicillium argentinense]